MAAVFKPSALLEGISQLDQIRIVRRAFCEEVEVVGHGAKCMQEEVILGGMGEEVRDYAIPLSAIRENRATVLGADRDEIGAFATVVVGGEADRLLIKGHILQW